MLLNDDPVNAFVRYPPAKLSNAAAGPLAGLTFAVKDIYDVAGYPTGCGSPIKQAESPVHTQSAPVVEAVLAAGGEFVGKTQTDELAFSLNGQNRHFPEPVNPRAPGRVTGGSSSGSASAVAAGLCDFAFGSDTGGSVRGPAGYCGLWGIRPTHGRVSDQGVMPLAASYDTVGFFADHAETFAKVAPVVLGDDEDAFALDRLLRATDAFDRLTSEREAAALQPIEAKVEAVLGAAEDVTVAPDGLDTWYWSFRRLQASEGWQAHGAWIEANDPVMTEGVRERFEFGRDLPAAEHRKALDDRERHRARLDAVLAQNAVLMLPTMPTIAPPRTLAGDALQAYRERALAVLCMAGQSGLPQVTMPLATLDGCPMGLSLIGPRGSDRALIALALQVAAR